MKKILFVIYQAPGGTIWPNEGFRTAFGMYADDVEPEVLLIDQAAITVARETEPKKLGLLSIKMVQKYIGRYDTKVLVEKESLEKFYVTDLDEAFQAEVLSRAELHARLPQYDHVVFM
jgi:tRNA 2-thiouridine synthesizing protein C